MTINKCTTNADDVKKAMANNTMYIVQELHTLL